MHVGAPPPRGPPGHPMCAVGAGLRIEELVDLQGSRMSTDITFGLACMLSWVALVQFFETTTSYYVRAARTPRRAHRLFRVHANVPPAHSGPDHHAHQRSTTRGPLLGGHSAHFPRYALRAVAAAAHRLTATHARLARLARRIRHVRCGHVLQLLQPGPQLSRPAMPFNSWVPDACVMRSLPTLARRA